VAFSRVESLPRLQEGASERARLRFGTQRRTAHRDIYFVALIRGEADRFGKLVRDAHITLE
jgi:hypothetical protein